jgi:hypothetical protein
MSKAFERAKGSLIQQLWKSRYTVKTEEEYIVKLDYQGLAWVIHRFLGHAPTNFTLLDIYPVDAEVVEALSFHRTYTSRANYHREQALYELHKLKKLVLAIIAGKAICPYCGGGFTANPEATYTKETVIGELLGGWKLQTERQWLWAEENIPKS